MPRLRFLHADDHDQEGRHPRSEEEVAPSSATGGPAPTPRASRCARASITTAKALSKRVVVGVSPQGKTGRVTYWCGTGRAPKSLSFKIRPNGSFGATSRNRTIIFWSISGRFVSDLQAVVRLGLKTDCHGKGGKLSPALSTPQQLQLAKQATAKYSSVAAAEKAGYHTALGPDGKPVCIASPTGGMGIHYENQALMRDGGLDIRRPEMLVYAPQANGSLKLVALEYFKADRDQNLSTANDRPALYGHAFDGPMAEHHPGMGAHYDLHVWVWQSNPSGMFAQFNPTVSCLLEPHAKSPPADQPAGFASGPLMLRC